MSAADASHPLVLARSLTQRAQQLCIGLESGVADLYELVTPTTAELLHWWFGDGAREGRPYNFHAGQRQAILNVIVAHEVLDSPDLPDLYRQVCADALLTGTRLSEVSQPKHAHPKYCLKMATGTGKTWVLQALLVWQLLNRTAALDAGRDDPRFTRRFLVVAPGLIVYERLLDAFLGKERLQGGRDFSTSDTERYASLFVPPAYRDRVRQFVQSNVCSKQDIGLKATGNGMIAITNWHLLQDVGDELETLEADEAEYEAPAVTPEAHDVVRHVLPVAPGRATGNSLDVLDGRWARGRVIAFLQDQPDLMVFNDEAHHIHDLKRDGLPDEVEWQKSLSRIAEGKGRRFVQIDFSATPYNERTGRGRTAERSKVWFPHIVVDFDLKAAMRQGLVKSLVLDKRKEIGALPLEFTAERDDDGTLRLSEGQRVMLRAGLQKLRRLERDFAAIAPDRHPKMLVVCEDTGVSPLVAQFLMDEGLTEDDVLTVDSGRKAELGEKDWAPVRQRLFDVDRHATPRIIVSVLMLREGFDVNNICVIVPLRATGAQILLEQTVGRGLRLMWREPEFADLKRENRERIDRGEEPSSLIDILSIVEHPKFQDFYDELMQEGLVGKTGDDEDGSSTTADMISVPLRDDWEPYDFAIPFILREADEGIDHMPIDPMSLPSFTSLTRSALIGMLGKGDTFVSQDLQSSTLFGDYRVEGGVMQVTGYNELLSRLTRRIGQALSQPLPRGNRVAEHLATPYLQVNTTTLATAVDNYVRERLFAEPFEPFEDEQWRLLLLQPVIDHIVRIFGLALVRAEDRSTMGVTEVRHRRLSEVTQLPMREGHSMEVDKCIYTRQGWPARNGGLERAFIEWCQQDGGVQAFCKLSESRHDFARLRYVRGDGLPAFYFPDFLVRTAESTYLVETKAQQQANHPNVQRKRKAAATWCERINQLAPYDRGGRVWHYALVGEDLFYDWRSKNARLDDLLSFSRIRAVVSANDQGGLDL
ncbi:restriction endonuclease subunit R [Xanthomonas sp. Mitacek01]|nr:restriction endonuclease subunit R [Xanthomonas sp. Mitacek01]